LNWLNLELAKGKKAFRPGDLVRGQANWDLKQDVDWIEFRLLWYTEGKGTRDFAVIDQGRIEHPARSGSCEFEFRMPDSPYSYHGTHLSIFWALELLADRHRDAARVILDLSPD